ncbi:uncharacterized protein TrAtP1_013205 [Trichoderma atroviride]|uniref:uncharacterized protein n=1 Tax=Hypocrea atroviridis TaxID=63577 RepID=UPI00332F78BF|nr:hypothetical protein TrAtP1_013205 [Trichoderma atroviride]
MRSAIAILSLAASASAALNVHALLPRATGTLSDSDASKCASEALSIVSSLPTPPPAIVSDLTEHPQTDPCKLSVASSLSADYSSYEAKVLSWFSSHKDELTSLASDCSALASYTSLVPVCSNSLVAAAGASGATTSGAAAPTSGAAAPTGSGASKSSGAPKSGTSTAGGARETGMGLAVLAAAGLAVVL